MKKAKKLYVCQACGAQFPKWMGRCTECGEWDALTEEKPVVVSDNAKEKLAFGGKTILPQSINEVTLNSENRIQSGIEEFDRVLGGGLVLGSLVLIGGDPGIGKSTLMLQALQGLAQKGHTVLYVSGEESVSQLRMRSERLGALSANLLVLSEVDIDGIIQMVENQQPDVMVVDSIQTMFNREISSAPGTVSQVREATVKLMLLAKKTNLPTLLVGHVTKEGAIAGPRMLEHMVDTVLYFEGDRDHLFRVLRAVKNRFGSTNEIGVFEMKGVGLTEVPNPSAMFLSERSAAVPGSIVTASMEGTRPILAEVQALVATSTFGTPRRTVLGTDTNRVALLAAVVEKKLGLSLVGQDIFVNIAGGLRLNEPAVDLAVAMAIVSSYLNKELPQRCIIVGEVGLTGEIRAVPQLEQRLYEAAKMGFDMCLVPNTGLKAIQPPKGVKLLGVKNIEEATAILF